ncbi:MAG: cyclic lactone autoinducer peptide [Erysipelotrichaceae bacterium]|nr:cyclic lactone autoinducer peptide [Erysipelotrichaceae bacterium]
MFKERRVHKLLESIERILLKTLKLVAILCSNLMSLCTFYQPKLPKKK